MITPSAPKDKRIVPVKGSFEVTNFCLPELSVSTEVALIENEVVPIQTVAGLLETVTATDRVAFPAELEAVRV
jgi:hypothetical protein